MDLFSPDRSINLLFYDILSVLGVKACMLYPMEVLALKSMFSFFSIRIFSLATKENSIRLSRESLKFLSNFKLFLKKSLELLLI